MIFIKEFPLWSRSIAQEEPPISVDEMLKKWTKTYSYHELTDKGSVAGLDRTNLQVSCLLYPS